MLPPINATADTLGEAIADVLKSTDGPPIDSDRWERGRYCPTPTIIEAAMALYGGHSVTEISRATPAAINLSQTSAALSDVIRSARENSRKCVCFVTGVPGKR